MLNAVKSLHAIGRIVALFDIAGEVKMISDQNVELSKVVAQGGASEVIALVHGYGDLAHDAAAGACCCKGCCPSTSHSHRGKTPATLTQCK
ncbi:MULTISPECIES: hypothetical protein [unclassified Caballeronia]|uniref:hypothetical protein n=1 Tax=unclassified Caballeronia TaxID=2646786 RepID=UPI0013EA4519|nr:MULTISPECIES: hypothetical protein [unclassified Caballeronia]